LHIYVRTERKAHQGGKKAAKILHKILSWLCNALTWNWNKLITTLATDFFVLFGEVYNEYVFFSTSNFFLVYDWGNDVK